MTDFNVCDAFRIFDEREEGRLTPHDLLNGLSDIGLVVLPDQVTLFFNYFDRDGDGLIAFSEFMEVFTPLDKYY
jgi:Ca2+-binding EF-hand superfamily protein